MTAMSNFNYMDSVPVKIAESYKPLPKVFQIPQAIAHKLQLSSRYYFESPQYAYDFQLEKKVLAKIPEWRRMRQNERDARRERKQKREEQRMRAVEQQHKQMLGAVNYPDAEDLSDSPENSSDEDDDNNSGSKKAQLTRISVAPALVASNGPRLAMTEAGSFHNILQPTILPQTTNGGSFSTNNGNKVHSSTHHSRTKSSSSFNYKDFEEDTSSPFDNIELKTINDLDILAQVLQNTQIKTAVVNNDEQQKEHQNVENTVVQPVTNKTNICEDESKECPLQENTGKVENLSLQCAKSGMEEKDFTITATHIPINKLDIKEHSYTDPTAAIANSLIYNHQTGQNLLTQPIQHQLQASYITLNQTQQHYNLPFNQHTSYATNQNYLFNAATCNGIDGNYYNSPSREVQATSNRYIGYNANTYFTPSSVCVSAVMPDYDAPKVLVADTNVVQENELKNKSKSVPDILKELTDELRNSEIRRSRNYSHSRQYDEIKAETEIMQQASTNVLTEQTHSSCYAKLEVAAQKMAKNISSMGFPLERVAKVAQIFGADDKKVIEHLIPLSELVDLGFDESRISEALVKFDNNKEKALEYLIS